MRQLQLPGGSAAHPARDRTGAAHLRDNLAAVDVALSDAELQTIEQRFPRPVRKQPLAMN